ncbi:MAG: phosphotransferase [Armatimonadetes bacterium]|nr:phosphotransferase [Armatimonadota bacterium]
MNRPFGELTHRQQLNLLRPIAREFAARFGHADAQISCINHGFNTTYKITTPDGTRYAMRININSFRTDGETNFELNWVRAIGEETDIPVATPQVSKSGNMVESKAVPWREEQLKCVLYSWLEGRGYPYRNSEKTAKHLGEVTTKLNQHGEQFQSPFRKKLTLFPDCIFGHPLDFRDAEKEGDMAPVRELISRANDVIARLKKTPAIPIHYDLHAGNIKIKNGKAVLLDFDDCILGWPMLDASVSRFYFRHMKPAAVDAYFRGLGWTPPDLGFTWEDFNTLQASRGIFLANEFLKMETAELMDMAKPYAIATIKRSEKFLRTGEWDYALR